MTSKKISKKDAELLAQLRANGLHAEARRFESAAFGSYEANAVQSSGYKAGDILYMPARWAPEAFSWCQVTAVKGGTLKMNLIYSKYYGINLSKFVQGSLSQQYVHIEIPSRDNFVYGDEDDEDKYGYETTFSGEVRAFNAEELEEEDEVASEFEGQQVVYLDGGPARFAVKWNGDPIVEDPDGPVYVKGYGSRWPQIDPNVF